MAKKTEKLTPDQEMFCLEYLKDFNGTQAAIRAGYSEKTASEQASRLLTNVKVQLRLKDAIEEVLGDKAADVKAIIDELKRIAFGDISDVMDWGEKEVEIFSEDGSQSYKKKINVISMKDKNQIGDKSKMIAEISESESMMGRSRKLKMYDKLRAIELLGKYYKMFTDKVEHTSPDGSMRPQVFIHLPKNGREST